MAEIGNDITKAKSLLERGQLVAIPTETVYGLAANATDPIAVARIFSAKKRPHFDPLIIHVAGLEAAEKWVKKIPESARRLATKAWPGPMTILLPKKEVIPDLVTSGLDTVAVRVPNHPMTLQLLRQLDFPLAAPSANPFGYISPTSAEHVDQQLGEEVQYILDGGTSDVGVESTIISFEKEVPEVLRLGGKSVEELESLLGELSVKSHSSSNPVAPGMLESHYAPRTPMILQEFDSKTMNAASTGILTFKSPVDGIPIENQWILSENGNLEEAAKNLFRAMRELDQKPNISLIIGQLVPEQGLGRAINDRIRRATTTQN